MTLKESISNAIEEFGKDIITEPRFVNILADYDAFADSKQMRMVVKEMVEQGFMSRLLAIDSNVRNVDEIVRILAYDAQNIFPFREDLIQAIVSTLVYNIIGIDVCTNEKHEDKHNEPEEWKPTPLPDLVISDDGKILIRGKENLCGVVIIPNGVEVIGQKAFEKCIRIKKVIVPEGALTICDSAFSQCTELEEVCLPQSLKYIEGMSFYRCEKLRSITLPNELERLGGSAFAHCSMLTHLVIQDKLRDIKMGAFSCACTCSENNKYYCSQDGALYSKDMKLLYRVPNDIEHYVMPNQVEVIKSKAITGCQKLTRISFSNKLTEIESFAIEDNPLIKRIHLPSCLRTVGNYNFSSMSSLEEINLPASLKEVDDDSFKCFDYPSKIKTLYSEYVDLDEIDIYLVTFSYIEDRCTLYVPAGTSDAHKEYPAFREFKAIKEYYLDDKNNETNAKNIINYKTKYNFYRIENVTLGETTWEGAEWVGHKVEKLRDRSSRYIHGKYGTFWDYDSKGYFDHYCVSGLFHSCSNLPLEWSSLGIKKDMSYKELVSLFKSWGFTIKTNNHLARYATQKEIQAESYDKSITFVLNFEFGMDIGERALTKANSLYSITAKV